ncbi:substrate-binding domain-containing protein [Microbispora sp. H10670]|uniref:substrate-binding domain-containing protein n=1 Tax=Microbispora sp. H10670 TaxID=2729108 RepID=UPI0015FEDE39|nr:substrate-binding domain-containing protein [Microbispora sp. H10670]
MLFRWKVSVLRWFDGWHTKSPRGPERPTAIFEAGAVSPTFEGGVADADVLLAASVTAVIAYDDMIALGLISHMTARRVRVPQDVSGWGSTTFPRPTS